MTTPGHAATTDVRRARVRSNEWMHTLVVAARTPRGGIGLGVTLAVIGIAVVGPFVSPHDPNSFVTSSFASASGDNLLGGDSLGRDVLSRVLAGGWQILLMAGLATAFGVVVGAMVGMAAAYLPGWRDNVLMRAMDVILAFPQLVFALLLVSVLGAANWLLVVAVGFSHVPQVSRVIRSAALDVSERDYVKAVVITGARPAKVMRREILPSLVAPLMVELGLRAVWSIGLMAGLSYLGFGLQPPASNWGTMIKDGQLGILSNPWDALVPTVLLALLCIGLNTYTDAITRASLGIDRGEKFVLTEVVEAAGASEGNRA